MLIRSRTKRVVLAGAALALAAAASPAAAGAAPTELVTVVSVDGPLDLTVRGPLGRAPRKLRLAGLDAPRAASDGRPAECGAAFSQQALRAAAPQGSRLRITAKSRRKLDGRTLVVMRTQPTKGPSTFLGIVLYEAGAATLGGANWALDNPATPPALTALGATDDDGTDGPVSTRRPEQVGAGVWGECGRRLHAPIGAPKAPTPTWELDTDGILRGVGPAALSSELRPTTMTRFRDLAASLPDLEGVRDVYGTCGARSAIAGAQFRGLAGDDGYDYDGDPRPCRDQLVTYVESIGPVVPSRGPAVGARVSELTKAFPRLRGVDPDDFDLLSLVPGSSTPWAWNTSISAEDGVIVGFSASIVVNFA